MKRHIFHAEVLKSYGMDKVQSIAKHCKESSATVLPQVCLLKIDSEGAELKVLRSAVVRCLALPSTAMHCFPLIVSER